MSAKDILPLIQFGFAGFVAAMAMFSYRLMRQEASRTNRNLKVYEQIQRFARYTLTLSFVVLLGSIVEGFLRFGATYVDAKIVREHRQAITLSQEAQDCREALTGLVGAEASGMDEAGLRQINIRVYQSCFRVMRSIEDLEQPSEP